MSLSPGHLAPESTTLTFGWCALPLGLYTSSREMERCLNSEMASSLDSLSAGTLYFTPKQCLHIVEAQQVLNG